uniref:Uncharacterized protein n=1 Tax=Meloidogyne enterolobii TaxID=390850 RepID=A0A6V7TIQ7_MELEN|nr:unnamed protein product [Meloidogyne enterolobii]
MLAFNLKENCRLLADLCPKTILSLSFFSKIFQHFLPFPTFFPFYLSNFIPHNLLLNSFAQFGFWKVWKNYFVTTYYYPLLSFFFYSFLT